MRHAFVLCCSAALLGTAGTASAQDWTKSKWGPNDEIGAANYMKPELVVKAASAGQDRQDLRARHPHRLQDAGLPAPRLQDHHRAARPGRHPRSRTKQDHLQRRHHRRLGRRRQPDRWPRPPRRRARLLQRQQAADFADPTGLKKLGIEKIPPLVARGVLLDMAAHYGTDVVKEGTAFNVKEIEEVAKKQGIEIRQGDVVIFHTGWVSLIGKDDKRYNAGEPGLGVEGAKYLTGKGVVAVGADTWGARGDAVREQEHLRGAPDPAADERHLHPGEHEHRRTRRRQGLRVPVRARPAAFHRRGAGIINPIAIR